jgi:hypothetical protein
MNDAMPGPFTVHSSGGIGQEIRNLDGKIIGWTTDEWTAQLIAQLLNENETLLFITKENRNEDTERHSTGKDGGRDRRLSQGVLRHCQGLAPQSKGAVI